MSEMYHYHYLLAGVFGIFVTAIISSPWTIGWRTYNVCDVRSATTASFPVSFLDSYSHWGFLVRSRFSALSVPLVVGWFFWAVVLLFVIKLDHPPVEDETPLDTMRMNLGWIALLILIVSFIPTPFLVM